MPPPKRSLGQHFLTDPGVCSKIVRAARYGPEDIVLEIGPGKGALTEKLLDTVLQVIAVELDSQLVDALAKRLALEPMTATGPIRRILRGRNMVLVESDIGEVKLGELPGRPEPQKKLRVVGNLPYNQATAILQRLLEQTPEIEDFTLMFQREVAERMLAPPGDRTYGFLSVIVQFHCRIQKLFNVAPGAFYPRPKVQSTMLHLKPIEPGRLPAEQRARFLRLVSASFLAKRKTLLNNLRAVFPAMAPTSIAEQCAAVQIDAHRRAETLTVEEFIALALQLTPVRGTPAAR